MLVGAFLHYREGNEGTVSESYRLENTSEIIKSNLQLNATIPTKPYHEIPSLLIF